MAKSSRTTNSVINLFTGFGGQLFITLLEFAVRTVFIKTLGSAYLGINGLFTNILSMLSLANLGIGSAIVYRLYKPIAFNDEKRVRVLLKFYKLAYRLIGVVVLTLGLLLIPFLPKLIKDYDSLAGLGINAVLLFCLFLLRSVCSYLFLAYRTTVISANQKRYILDIIHVVSIIVTSILQIVVLLLFKNFIVYTAIAILSAILNSLIGGIIAKKRYPQFFVRETESLSKAEIRDMLEDCGALFLYKVNTVVVKASDNLVLSAFIGIKEVGRYSNYILFYRTCVNILNKVFNAFRHSMGNLFATESIEKQYKFFNICNFLTALLFGTAGVGVTVCANELIEAWIGKSYVIPQPLPILIGIELLFAGVVVNLGQTRSVSGVFRQAWYRPLIGIIVNIVVSIVLVQVWGINGVVLGTIASYVLTNFAIEPRLIYKYAFQNIRPVSDYYKRNLLYIAVAVAACAADLWICSHVLTGHGWFSVIVHVLFTGLSVPAAFALLFWKTEECRYLRGLVQRIAKRLIARR